MHEVTEDAISNVFHDDMNGKVFTAIFEYDGKQYFDVFDTNLYLPEGVSVSFDSLNVSIHTVIPDLEYIKSVTSQLTKNEVW